MRADLVARGSGYGASGDWAWQIERNQAGFQRADAVVVPSRSHGAALNAVYDRLPPLHVIHNATAVEPVDTPKEPWS